MIQHRKGTLLSLLLLVLLCVRPAAAAPADPVLQIKAAFVLNFFKFTDWPPAVLGERSDDLLLAVVGEGAMVTALEETLAGKTAHGRRVRLLTFADAAALRKERRVVHALFVTATARAAWPELRAQFASQPVLTIADHPGFCAAGGMLNFFESNDRVRFEANPETVKSAGLNLSANVLELATIVNTTGAR